MYQSTCLWQHVIPQQFFITTWCCPGASGNSARAVQERVHAKMALVAQVRDAADALMHDNNDKAAALADAAHTKQQLQAAVERAQQAAQQRESDIAELALALDIAGAAPGSPPTSSGSTRTAGSVLWNGGLVRSPAYRR